MPDARIPEAIPAAPVGAGAVPGLEDTLIVLRARRARRALRAVARVMGGGALVAAGAVGVVAARAPERLLPACASRTGVARALLMASAADPRWRGAEPLQHELAARADARGGGIRWAITDVVHDDGARPRFLVWAFVDPEDDGARGAFVTDSPVRVTTVVEPCKEP